MRAIVMWVTVLLTSAAMAVAITADVGICSEVAEQTPQGTSTSEISSIIVDEVRKACPDWEANGRLARVQQAAEEASAKIPPSEELIAAVKKYFPELAPHYHALSNDSICDDWDFEIALAELKWRIEYLALPTDEKTIRKQFDGLEGWISGKLKARYPKEDLNFIASSFNSDREMIANPLCTYFKRPLSDTELRALKEEWLARVEKNPPTANHAESEFCTFSSALAMTTSPPLSPGVVRLRQEAAEKEPERHAARKQNRQSQLEKNVLGGLFGPSIKELTRMQVLVQAVECLCYGPVGVLAVPVSLPDAHGKLEARFFGPEEAKGGVKVVTCDVYTAKSGAKFVLTGIAPRTDPLFHGFCEFQLSVLGIENRKLTCYDPFGRGMSSEFDLGEQVDAPAAFGDVAGTLQYASLSCYLRDTYQAAHIVEHDGCYFPPRPLKIIEPHAVTRWQAVKGENGKITEVLAYTGDKEVMKTSLKWQDAVVVGAETIWYPGHLQARSEFDVKRGKETEFHKEVCETNIEFPGQRVVWEFATETRLSSTLPHRATFFHNGVKFAQVMFLGWRPR